MKVLIVHNRYRSDQPSGENEAVDRHIELMKTAGHDVASFERNSDEIGSYGFRGKLALPGRVVWSNESRREIEQALAQHRPDVIHIHNTFPLLSPSILAPCARAAPTVVSLHNYRLLCPHGQLLRDAKPCELCVGRIPWRGVLYGCYRESRLATAPMAVAIEAQRVRDIWNRYTSAFIALSAFASQKLIAGGLDKDRLHVLPNFAPRPKQIRNGSGEHFLFIGRLSEEKAPELVLEAWRNDYGKLLVVGDGPLRESVESIAARHGGAIEVLGRQPHERAMALLADARALIVTSCGYEAGPLILAEAFARGIPIIAPDLGAFADVVRDDVSGRLFTSGNGDELGACIRHLQDDEASTRMGKAAQDSYEKSFTPEMYLDKLLEIYEGAMARRVG